MTRITRRSFVLASLATAMLAATGLPARAASETLEVYKTPWCGCCTAWVDHMREAGFAVRVTEMEDLEPLKARHGVTEQLASCHTALIGGYVVEGHVPAAEVKRLLAEKPDAIGLTVPDMPAGSPGMGESDESYEVLLVARDGTSTVYARYPK